MPSNNKPHTDVYLAGALAQAGHFRHLFEDRIKNNGI